MKKGTAIILLLTAISCFLCGCSIEKVRAMDNAIHLQTTLLGPEDGEELKEEASYPCLVIKMKYREEPVIFE